MYSPDYFLSFELFVISFTLDTIHENDAATATMGKSNIQGGHPPRRFLKNKTNTSSELYCLYSLTSGVIRSGENYCIICSYFKDNINELKINKFTAWVKPCIFFSFQHPFNTFEKGFHFVFSRYYCYGSQEFNFFYQHFHKAIGISHASCEDN